MHRTNEYVDRKINDLERELAGVQEMLAFVLQEAGKPVTVPKSRLKEGLQGVQIQVDDNHDEDAFVFSLVEVQDDDTN